jgi:hypothetical protein
VTPLFKNAGRVKELQDLLAIRQWRGDGVWMESDHAIVARKVAVSENGSSGSGPTVILIILFRIKYDLGS